MLTRLLSVFATLSFAALAFADGPEAKFDQHRAEAEVIVMIQVISVKEEVHGASKDVTITAKVLGVEKSAFGTKKGEEITIFYTDSVKPGAFPKLEKDEVYPAFLKRNGKVYEPAAWVASFRMKPEGNKATQSTAEKLGTAMITVETFLKALPTDPKRDDLQKAVIEIGQSGGYVRVQARLGWECTFLEGHKAELGGSLTKEQAKEMDDQIAYLKRTLFIIDAPK